MVNRLMFKSNAALLHKTFFCMSLNRCEQTVFDYWQSHPDERSHWRSKVNEVAQNQAGSPVEMARRLERELWEYFIERTRHVAPFREVNAGELRRVSLMNLAEYVILLWGPPPKPKNPTV